MVSNPFICFIALSEIVSTIPLFFAGVVTVPRTNKPRRYQLLLKNSPMIGVGFSDSIFFRMKLILLSFYPHFMQGLDDPQQLHEGKLTPRAWLHTCRRQGLWNGLPGTPSAANSDAGRANRSARQGVSGEQVAKHGSKTPHQILQATVNQVCALPLCNMTCPLIVQSPGPQRRRQVQDHILPLQSVSNPLRQATQEAHSRRFKP